MSGTTAMEASAPTMGQSELDETECDAERGRAGA